MNSVQLLERLVAFPTVSRDSNLPLIEFITEYLAGLGVQPRRYLDSRGQKANLYASIGPADRGGLLLSGHTDVVPVDGQAWVSDPFRLSARAGRLYARGAADMKGFIACALRLAKIASQCPLRVPLQLAFSYDEEVGCVGVRSLIADMATWGHRPQFCVVGEPTLLTTAVGHKGKTALTATCHGRAAHSAYPGQGVNAIHMAADLVMRLRARQSLIETSSACDAAYSVPHSTLHVGVIRGGTALNMIPARCELELEIRNLPTEDPSTIVDGLRADAELAAASVRDGSVARIDIDVVNTYPGLDTPCDSAVVQLLTAATGNGACVKVGFGSEGGLFSNLLGIPTAICGPGSIDQAHKPDEFVTLDQLHRCDAMMDALLGRLLSG